MNSFKKLYVSIKSQIDHAADEFENHEALAEAAIKDLQAVAGKTRLHLHRLHKMSEHYQAQLQQQQKEIQRWSERALKTREQDEQKALQCMKRVKQTQQQIDLLEQQLSQTEEQESKIKVDLNNIQEQLLSLKNKKEILAARENRTGLREKIQDIHSNQVNEANEIFDRWEGTVVSSELDEPDFRETDTFAQSFEQEEETLELKMMLDELAKKDQDDNNSTGEDHVR